MTNDFKVYFFDVGQGDCSLICPPEDEGNPILMDCRSAQVARRSLNELKIKHLEAIIVSHLDKDHISGMHRFINEFLHHGGTVERVYIDTDRKELTDEAITLVKECLRWHDERQFELAAPRRSGSALTIRGTEEWRVELISPQHSLHLKHALRKSDNPNALSVVIRIHCFGRSILIGADAPLSTWEHVENEYLPAEIFRVPHHGADIEDRRNRWPSMADFYLQSSPELAVISVGTRNGDEHPTRKHLRSFAASCRKLCTQLTPRCHDSPPILRRQALEKIRADAAIQPYRHDEETNEVPCAGTVMVRVSPGGRIETFPSPGDWHDDFIGEHVPHALCRP